MKKILLVLILLGLFGAGVLLIFRPGNGDERFSPVVQAAQPNSNFTNPVNISNSSSYNSTQHPRLVIAPDTYLHVTWMEGIADTANGPAYLRGREGEWPTWEWAGPHNNPGYTNPHIALGADGTVHLAWACAGPPYDICYAYKPVGGSWSAPVNISNMAGNTVYPSIALDNQGTIWVAWQTSLSDTDTAVYVAYKPSGGNWSTPVMISPDNREDQNPSLAIGPGNVPHVVWRSNNPGNWEILYSKFEGGSWTAPLNISATSTASHFPRIAADSAGNLFVVWEDEIDGPDVFQILFRRWDGSQWLPYKRVSSSTKALYPAISFEGCNLYVVWQDYRGGLETYFSHSTDCGNTWLGDENVSRNTTSSYFPDIVAQSGGFSHIVWQDMLPGQLDIYYSKATVAAPPTPTPIPPTPTNTPPPAPAAAPARPGPPARGGGVGVGGRGQGEHYSA